MSKISVTTIAGLTSGGDANKVKIESGDQLGVGTTPTHPLTVNGQIKSIGANGETVQLQTSSQYTGLSFVGSDGTRDAIIDYDHTGGFMTVKAHTTGHNIRFTTGGYSERFRITDNGVTFNGDTAAANALDDYEEGSWTPFYTSQHGNLTLNGNASNTSSMYTTQGGSYIKIGKKVICHMSLATNGVTSFGGSGNLWVAGLPFANATTTASKPRGVNGCMAGRFNSFTPDQLVCNSNATTMQIRAGFESYPDINKLDVGGSGNRNVIEALIVYETA